MFPSLSNGTASINTAEEEFDLLGSGESLTTSLEGESQRHDLDTAPLITRDAFNSAGCYHERAIQYGVMGKIIPTSDTHRAPQQDPRLYLNTNAPFSAVVCGVQGSGKSHTVSILLENMFIPLCPQLGSLSKPLAGLVLHYGEGGASSLPSEAAWVGVTTSEGIQAPKIRVLVPQSSLQRMRTVYSPLGDNITIVPLVLSESELDAHAFLSMMAVGSSDSPPLYIQMILSILRDLGDNYSYPRFVQELEVKKKDFNPAQLSGLVQRMALLKSFLEKPTMKKTTNISDRFQGGQITVVDLSDPFIDATSACGIFEIVTRLFVRADVGTGKVLVVDEAHKYLSTTKGASGLTQTLLSLTRQQRHLGMRVIISTQEPTVIPPVILDLCTIAILHRFSSPSWWEHLLRHVSADFSGCDALDKIVRLQTGEAIVLAPSGLWVSEKNEVTQIGRQYLVMKTRKRVTVDGGASILVLNTPN